MKQTLLFFSFILYAAFVFSQDSYVSLNNDVIHGTVVNYKEWSKNPSSIIFKDSVNGNIINLTPANCKSFTAGTSDKFISYSGTRVLNADRIENAHTLQSDSLTKDSAHVFLREIYQYKNYALYKLFDDKRANFYLADGGIIKELEYFEYINEDKRVVQYDTYKNYLIQLFPGKNIGELEHKVDVLEYKESSLISFLADVLGDKNSVTERSRNKYPGEVLPGIAATANFGSITHADGVSYHQTTISPSFDISLRIYSQRNFGKLFFQPSVSITPLSQTFGTDFVFIAKSTVISAKLGAGYFFQKSSNFSVYGALQGGLTFLFGYKTHEGLAGNQYGKESGAIDKATVYPELGVVIKRSINVAVTGMLPIKVPFVSDNNFDYKISEVNLIVRYVFSKKR